MQCTWQLALVPVYFIKHSISCYIYYMYMLNTSVVLNWPCVQLMYNRHAHDGCVPEEVRHEYLD